MTIPWIDAATRAVLERTLADTCRRIGWPVGHAYRVEHNGSVRLVPTDVWHVAEPARFATLRRATRLTAAPEITHASIGTGLPRRVVESRSPVWVPDVTRDPRFLRAELIDEDLGVRTACAVPVTLGARVAYVLEFFCEEPRAADDAVIEGALQGAREAESVLSA